MVEVGGYRQLRAIIDRDYQTFSGHLLERYFHTQFMEQKRYSRIGGYWDRKGETEIDLIAVDELEKTAVIAEIKRHSENISLGELREKAAQFMKTTDALSDYEIEYRALSLDAL